MFHVKHRVQKYEGLVDFLLERNKVVNLTAVRNRDDAAVKHVEDSLVIADHIKRRHSDARTLLDLGTGPGFPGLVIANECPFLSVTLLDSTEKKIRYVKDAISYMALSNTTAIAGRAESFALLNKGIFDVVVVRSVAHLDVLLEYASPLLKLGGFLLAMKSFDTSTEFDDGQNVAKLFGFELPTSFPYTLLKQNRSIFSFKKLKKPSIDLPRKVGAAANNPILRRM